MNRTLKIGIADYAAVRERTLRIARGDLKPKPGDPKVWFPSLESLAKVLSEPNRQLLGIIEARKPQSIGELSRISGRASSNLSRTLRTMEKYGLVELRAGGRRQVVPRAPYARFRLEMPVAATPRP